jgi:hypothetical protein
VRILQGCKEEFEVSQSAPGEIRSAQAVNLGSGEVQELSTREGSACHFFGPIEIGGYLVKFRLDWNDVDEQGRPMLDADFYNKDTEKKLSNSGSRACAHHTEASDSEARIYEWEFKQYGRHFKVILHFLVDVRNGIAVSDEVSVEVVKAAKQKT